VTDRRPVIALDVDGVLNPAGAPTDLGPGWKIHRIEVPEVDVPRSPFVPGRGDRDISVDVCLNAGLHGAWITKMHAEGADVVWATTWEDAANGYLAPLLGIDPLPVGIRTTPEMRSRMQDSARAWKSRSLPRLFRGRPLAWVDNLADTWGLRAGREEEGDERIPDAHRRNRPAGSSPS